MFGTEFRPTAMPRLGRPPRSFGLAFKASPLLAIVALALAAAPGAAAQDYTTTIGNTNFSTNQPVKLGYVNAANGDLHIEIPLGTFPQRGKLDYAARLSYDSRIWQPVNNGISTAWEPDNVPSGSGGWRLLLNSVNSGGSVDYGSTGSPCNTGSEFVYQNFTWTAPDSTVHGFGSLQTINAAGRGCPDSSSSTASGYSTDSTGYYIKITNYTQATVWDRNGTTVYSSSGASSYEDANGNYFTVNGNGDLVDSLGRTPITTTTNCGSSTWTCYDVLNAQGGTSRYVVKWGSISVSTAFGVLLWSEYTGSISVVQSIQLPDGTTYQFTYDTGLGSGRYGELTGVTLPTGGQTSYSYANFEGSAGNINSWLTSESDGGGTETYTQSTVTSCGTGYRGCNQVVVNRPSGEQIVYTFGISGQGAWHIQAQYETSAGALVESASTTWDTTNQVKTTENISWPGAGEGGSGTITRTTQWTNYSVCGDPGQTSEWRYYSGSLPLNPDRVTTVTFTSESGVYANIPCLPASITVQASGATVAQTNISYDSTSLTSVTGAAHHDDTNYGTGNAVRGNPTQIQRLISGSTYATTTLAYDTTGQVASTQDPNGNTTTFSYADSFYNDNGLNPPSTYSPLAPANAYLTQVTPPNVNGVSHASYFGYYYGTGEKAFSKDANSQLTYMHYADPFSRPTQTDLPDGGWKLTAYTSPNKVDIYTGVRSGSAPSTSCNESACRQDESVLDSWGHVVDHTVNDPAGATTVATTYDGDGRVTSVTNPYRSGDTIYSTSYAYDALDRVVTVTRPDQSAISYSYGSGGSQLCSSSTYGIGYGVFEVDEAGKKRETWADGFGRTIEVDEPDSSNNLTQATCYQHDANNNLAQAVSPNGATRSFSYDDLSRLTSGTTPEGGTVSYTYDGNGNVLTRVAPKENQTSSSVTVTTTYSYDALNRLTQKSYNDNTTPNAYFVYDQPTAWGLTLTNPIGRMTTAYTIPPGGSSAQTNDLFEYDAMGGVTETEECQPQNCATAPNLAAQYTYDLLGDATSLHQQDYSGAFNFTLSYAYNGIGQLSGITSSWSDSTHPATLVSNATYSAAGKPAGDTLGNNLTETFGYNSRLWPSSATTGSVYSLSLGYAANGSVTTANDSVNGNSTLTYDNVNRLTTMSAPSSPTGCYGLSWTYDSVGNRTAQSVTSGTCPASSQGFGTNNQITSPAGYHYDAAGNMTNDTVHGYTYDAEGRILTVDGGAGAYVYDAFGRRIEKTTGSTSVIYLYDVSGREIAVVSTAGANVQDDIYAGSRHLAMYANSTTSFFHADQVGTERVRTTVSGAVDETCTSLPFGDSQSCTSGEPVGRFAGHERDNEYGLAHAPARYYSPTLGRFMTPDPLNAGVPQVSYPDPGVVTLAAMLSGHVLAPLGLSSTKHAPGPQVQSLGGQVPLAAPGCSGCGCSAASAGGKTLISPQTLNRYAYVLNSPASFVDPTGTDFFTQICLDICFIEEAVCETTCFFFVFVPPPFGEAFLIGCSATCIAFEQSCEAICGGT